MKKRHHLSLQEKDYRRLVREQANNYQAQRNLGWVQLEEPIHHGYYAFLTLRQDIANREDAWIFQEIVDKFGTTSWSRKINDFDHLKPGIKTYHGSFQVYHVPHITGISAAAYQSLQPCVRKHFTKSTLFSSAWRGDQYYCNIPSFYFEVLIEKSWTTRVRIYDEILQQEASEIEAELQNKHYSRWRQGTHVPKSYRQGLNRKQRAQAKQIMYRNWVNETELEFTDNYKNAAWLYW